MEVVNIKKLVDDAVVPTSGSEWAAGVDLYAAESAIIAAGETAKITTGIALEIPAGYFGGIYARSGLATKQGLRPANCVGVVDADYRGPVIVALHNDSPLESRIINKGDRIAQLIIQPYLPFVFREVETLSETVRGECGFGSTGVNNNQADKEAFWENK